MTSSRLILALTILPLLPASSLSHANDFAIGFITHTRQIPAELAGYLSVPPVGETRPHSQTCRCTEVIHE